MIDPNQEDDLAKAFSLQSLSAKRQAEKQRAAAQRRVEQTVAGGRLKSGEGVKLGTQIDTEINANLEQSQNDLRAQEALLRGQQSFARGEREFAQAFQSGEADKERVLKRQTIELAGSQLNEQIRQFNKEFDVNVQTLIFNKLVALKDFDQPLIDRAKGILRSSGFPTGI